MANIKVQNPWSVKNLEYFLYFCCPECEIKDKSKEMFIKHALDFHENARKYLIDVQIKTEICDDSNETNVETDSENNDLFIKIENNELFDNFNSITTSKKSNENEANQSKI